LKTAPVFLLICDGWGHAPPSPGNAIALARTPIFDRWQKEYPWTLLEASGESVGLPEGVMGNSEVGHLTLGAGRMVPQDLLRIDLALRDGSFFENPALREACAVARRGEGTLHLMGLLSDGGVHSHERHLEGLLALAARESVPRVRVHAFTDGRDTPPKSALAYVASLEAALAKAGGRIATVSGRYYAMDRDKRWDRVARAYQALVFSSGLSAQSPKQAVEAAYGRGESDEFIQPTVVTDAGEPVGPIRDGDAVVFFNFRADRARQLTSRLLEHGYRLTTMTRYRDDFDCPVAFPEQDVDAVVAEVLAEHGVRQLHAAETEKYAHVTYFFNGGREDEWPGETRILVPSPREVGTYDKKPEMSARELSRRFCDEVGNGHGFAIVNFANPDMVGHTGSIPAVTEAVETVDECLGEVIEAVARAGGISLVTADHGNAEQMLEPDGVSPHTAHTSNPVPLVLTTLDRGLREGGELADLAPTALELLGLPKPLQMSGKPLTKLPA
jgi:2,3-bisphosphoglycerate-independent phosphoglycerate mutase